MFSVAPASVAPTTHVKTFISGGAITALTFVRYDVADATGETVVAGAVDGLTCGVALDAATGAGQEVRVAIKGAVYGVDSDGGAIVSAGDSLVSMAGGLAATYTGAEAYGPVGVAMTTAAVAGDPIDIILK